MTGSPGGSAVDSPPDAAAVAAEPAPRWPRRSVLAVGYLAAAMLLAATAGLITVLPASVADEEGAVALELEFFDGTTAALADFAGEPLVVNFYASWCATCVSEMPDFERVHQDLGDEVRFIGINLQDESEAGLEVAQDAGVTYELARDQSGEIYAAFGAVAMPTTVLIEADGTVVTVHGGLLTEAQLAEKIEQELLT